MNYLKLIANFWQVDMQQSFNGNETRLYFFLLHLANGFYWREEWFEYANERLMAYVGISHAVLCTARQRLKDAGLIDFVSGGSGYRVKTRYRILAPNQEANLQPSQSPSPTSYYNKVKTKTNGNDTNRFSKREYVASGSDFD
jgi:hypothetical protein